MLERITFAVRPEVVQKTIASFISNTVPSIPESNNVSDVKYLSYTAAGFGNGVDLTFSSKSSSFNAVFITDSIIN